MSAQYHFVTADRQDRDMYVRERVLNSSIIAADLRGKDHVGRSYSTSSPRCM